MAKPDDIAFKTTLSGDDARQWRIDFDGLR